MCLLVAEQYIIYLAGPSLTWAFPTMQCCALITSTTFAHIADPASAHRLPFPAC